MARTCEDLRKPPRGAPALDVLPHVPGDGDHGVPVERGDARARAADRGARVAEDDEALRPDGGHGDGRRDRAYRDLSVDRPPGEWRGGSRPRRRRADVLQIAARHVVKRPFATHADRLRPRLEDRRLPVAGPAARRPAGRCRRRRGQPLPRPRLRRPRRPAGTRQTACGPCGRTTCS